MLFAGAAPRLLPGIIEQDGRQAVALRGRVLQEFAEHVSHLLQGRVLWLAESDDALDRKVDLSVIVRGDSKTKYRQIRAVLDVCQQANVVKVDLATEPAKGR